MSFKLSIQVCFVFSSIILALFCLEPAISALNFKLSSMNLLNTHPKLTLIFTSEFVPKTGLALAEYWAPCWKALASNVQYGLNKVQEEYNNGLNSIYLFKSNFLFSNSQKH